MRKFKVGDKVKILNNNDGNGFDVGEIVEVTNASNQYSLVCKSKENGRDYYLCCMNVELVNQTSTLDNDIMIEKLKKHCSISSCEDCVLCDEWCQFEDSDTDELEYLYNLAFENDQSNLVNDSESTFTITTSDTITTLSDGTHVTTINRYYTDKHNDMVALEEVVKKYKSEIEKMESKSKEPKVGDKVKVIDDGRVYSMYINWLITNNVSLESAIKWQCGKFPNNEEKYIIKEIHPHAELKKNVLALIEDEYSAYIIDIKGLEVIK